MISVVQIFFQSDEEFEGLRTFTVEHSLDQGTISLLSKSCKSYIQFKIILIYVFKKKHKHRNGMQICYSIRAKYIH